MHYGTMLPRRRGLLLAARTWYTKVLDLWADADAELQSVMERIRRSRAALGQGS